MRKTKDESADPRQRNASASREDAMTDYRTSPGYGASLAGEGRRPRVRPEIGHADGVSPQILVGQRVGEHTHVRQAPVHVERVRHAVAIGFQEMKLTDREIAVDFGDAVVVQPRQHTRRVFTIRAADHEIRIRTRAQFGTPIMGARQRRPQGAPAARLHPAVC